MDSLNVGKMVTVHRLSGRIVKRILRENDKGELYVVDSGRVCVRRVQGTSDVYRQFGFSMDNVILRVTLKEDK